MVRSMPYGYYIFFINLLLLLVLLFVSAITKLSKYITTYRCKDEGAQVLQAATAALRSLL